MSIPTIIDTLCEISGQLHGIHSSIKRQTEILVTMRDKPKEAAPAPKAITWQEAVKVLADACGNVDGVDCALDKCPMRGWCSYARKGNAPQYWVVPLYEKEAADE